MGRSSASADSRNAKLCGLYSHGRVITFLVTSLSHPALFHRSFHLSPSFILLEDPLVPCAGNDPSRACNFHPEMARVVQLDNDNKDNSDKNNCYSNEKNHGAGSDLAYCKRLPLSLSTTWKMIILLISRSYLKFLRFKCRKIKRVEYLKKKSNGLYTKVEFLFIYIIPFIISPFINISRSFCASVTFKKPDLNINIIYFYAL